MKKNLSICRLYVLITCSLFLLAGCAKDDTSLKNQNPDAPLGQAKDVDGNSYDMVRIGDQVWFKQNLTTTRLNDGTELANLTDGNQWGELVTPGFCWYNNDSMVYGTVYGALYNRYAVATGKLCPVGYRVPTIEDVNLLIDHLGGVSQAGSHMKSNTHHWAAVPNYEATNTSGFSALPGGMRFCTEGEFQHVNMAGYWWTSTPIDEYSKRGFGFSMNAGEHKVHINDHAYFHFGNSVRCMKE